VGNDNYPADEKLSSCIKDANDMTKALERYVILYTSFFIPKYTMNQFTFDAGKDLHLFGI
jgi:hypothetical protein